MRFMTHVNGDRTTRFCIISGPQATLGAPSNPNLWVQNLRTDGYPPYMRNATDFNSLLKWYGNIVVARVQTGNDARVVDVEYEDFHIIRNYFANGAA